MLKIGDFQKYICSLSQVFLQTYKRRAIKKFVNMMFHIQSFVIILKVFGFLFSLTWSGKGQLISKCRYAVIVSTKKPTIFF